MSIIAAISVYIVTHQHLSLLYVHSDIIQSVLYTFLKEIAVLAGPSTQLIIPENWLLTEIKPRFCKTSENYFLGSHLKVQVKLPLKIEK